MFEQHIEKWIERLSVKHQELSGFSICPYAARAKYKIAKDINDAISSIVLFDFDIAIVKMEDNLTADNLDALTQLYNQQYSHLDVWFLYDSFREVNTIGRFETGNGEYNLILVQPYNDLQKRSQHLADNTTYYSHWSEDYFNKIVRSRDERKV